MNKVNVDSLIVTPLQKSLAEEITNKAFIYSNYFDSLSQYCDCHLRATE